MADATNWVGSRLLLRRLRDVMAGEGHEATVTLRAGDLFDHPGLGVVEVLQTEIQESERVAIVARPGEITVAFIPIRWVRADGVWSPARMW